MRTANQTASATVTAAESQAKEVSNLLFKAAKNYQLYLSNNKMFKASLESLKTALDEYLEENEVLTLVVKEFELLHRDTPVYTNVDKFQSLAFRMYRDGVRLISFHRGIGNDEIIAFFEALTKCMETESLEEDFVTLLWEKDLHSITYYEVNDFDADYHHSAGSSEQSAEASAPLRPPDEHAGSPERVRKELEHLKPTIELTPEDLQEVRDLAFAVQDEFFLARVWQVLKLTLESESEQATLIDLENGLIGFLDNCVARKQLRLAAEALSLIKQTYEQQGDQAVGDTLLKIVHSRNTEKNMWAVGEVLLGDREVEHDQCLAYLSQLDRDAIPAVVRLLPNCRHQSARRAVVLSLVALGRTRPADIGNFVDASSQEEVEVALDALDEIGEEDALACAMRFSQHSSSRVRAKVAFLAGKLKTPKALEVTQSLIQDRDHSVRRKALASLVEIDEERSAQTLMRLFISKDFGTFSHDSKMSMMLVMRNLCPAIQEMVIKSVLKMRSLFRRRPIEDTKTALIEVMHLMDHDVAMEALGKLLNSSSGSIRQAAEIALRKVTRADRT